MLLELIDITKKKPVRIEKSSIPDTHILKKINLRIKGGNPFIFLGPSGSGKSTLLRLLNRLSEPDDGTILFKEQQIHAYDVLELRRRVGYVSQIPVMFRGTVKSNFRYAITRMKDSQPDSNTFDDECVRLLGLLRIPIDFLDRDAEMLSVGEMQRISLARSLIRKPEVMLLDEPTSALDPTSTARFLDTLQTLRDEMNVDIIMVTHSIEQAKKIGGDAALIVNGGIIESGTLEKITAEPDYDITKKFIRGILDN